MTTYVALLRAVNIGSANRIKMVDLRRAFVDDGFADAVTHIQTGNVIFTSRSTPAAVKRRAESLILRDLGVPITAIVRTASDLENVIRSNPFAVEGAAIAPLHVVFLERAPEAAAVAALVARSGDEDVEVIGQEIFVRYVAGAGTSRFTGALIERTLGMAATARNWNVTTTLSTIAKEMSPS